jgi:primary-amine oxidase
MRHPAVLAEIEKLKLPPGMAVCNDPWMYGSDSSMLYVHG